MISDKERHEIAGKLRNLKPEYAYEDFFASNYLFETMGFEYWSETAYDNGVEDSGLTKTGLYKLADLIDRPTTTRHGKFKTKYGRQTPCCEVCGYSIGDMRWNHCPKCGAVITDD